MNAVGVFFLVFFLLLIAVAIGWILFVRWRAQRLGLPPPTLAAFNPFRAQPQNGPYGPPQPAPGGLFRARNARTAAGAYEEPLQQGGGGAARRRGFGPLDPDEAWDARVGAEADGYDEEQELGGVSGQYHRHPGAPHLGDDTAYGGASYAMNLATDAGDVGGGGGADDAARGRTRSREATAGGVGGSGAVAGAKAKNPFDDDADPSNVSLRGVSPRPIDTSAANATAAGAGEQPKDAGSPTERRSVFREDI